MEGIGRRRDSPRTNHPHLRGRIAALKAARLTASRFRLLPLLILLLAAALRFHALARDTRFHPDEALFASFARSAAVQGDWLLHGSLDKPPLTLYADALAMTLFGVKPLPNGVLTLDVHAGEFAARVPGTFASILLVALIYAVAHHLSRSTIQKNTAASRLLSDSNLELGTWNSALITAFLAALSPYALSFSATAFTDGLLLLMLTLALWSAIRGRAMQAGFWLALAFGCKQQAVFYLPLVLLLLWISRPPRRAALRLVPPLHSMERGLGGEVSREVKRTSITTYALLSTLYLSPLLLGSLLLFIWDTARGQSTSFWALAVANNDPGRLARIDEWLPRLGAWWSYAQYLFGGSIITLFMLFMAGFGLIGRRSAANIILAAYILLYVLFNVLIAFNIYDRYLLLLLPPLWLLTAHGIEDVFNASTRWGDRFRKPVFASLLLCAFALIILAFQSSEGLFPIGGDHGENTGIDRLGAYLDSKPLGAIIYDHWLGWELSYYLGTWSDKRRVYYPTPEALAADALLQPDPAPRYFAAPRGAPLQPWLDALRADGFTMSLVYDQPRWVVYELIPPAWVGCASNAGSSWPARIELFADSCA